MKTRENFSMDSPPTTTFTRHRHGIYLSRTSLAVIAAIVLCCLCGTAVLFYHFLQCHNNVTPSCNLDAANSHQHAPNHHNHNGNRDENEANVGGSSDKDKNETETEVIDLFLPRSVIPLQYDLQFIPFLDESNFTFNGVAKIRVRVTENCKNITLHTKALRVDQASVGVRLAKDQAVVEVVKQYIVEEKQFYVLELDEELQANEIYEVQMKFVGLLNDNLDGFYRSKYEVGNTTRWLAATQFQATAARKAFPCFDEPALKAKFNISVARPKDMISLSNMPIKSQIETV